VREQGLGFVRFLFSGPKLPDTLWIAIGCLSLPAGVDLKCQKTKRKEGKKERRKEGKKERGKEGKKERRKEGKEERRKEGKKEYLSNRHDFSEKVCG